MSWRVVLRSFRLLVLVFATGPVLAASSVQQITIPSSALGRDVPAELYLPPGFDPDGHTRLVVLLHGQNSTIDRFGRIGMYDLADALTAKGEIVPLVMVAPEIDNSFGINSPAAAHILIKESNTIVDYPKGAYEDFLTKDLLQFMAETYSAGLDAADRVYAGISMGGYAALRLGLAYPDLARRIAGHSPAIIGHGFTWLYPDEAAWQNRSLPLLAAGYAHSDQLFYIDCGTQDDFGFFPEVSRLTAILQNNKANVEFHSAKGGHNDEYWQPNVEAYLRFYGAP